MSSNVPPIDNESIDRLPSRWYPTGFLVPTNPNLSLRRAILQEGISA